MKAIIGLVFGFAVGFVLALPTCFIVSIAARDARQGEEISNYVPFAGAAIGFIIGIALEAQLARERQEAEQRRQIAVARSKLAEEQERRDQTARAAEVADAFRQRKEAEARRRQAFEDWCEGLTSAPVERIRFEYEKRQRAVQALHVKQDRLSREHSILDAENERWLRDDTNASYQPRAFSISDEIDECEAEIAETEREMASLQALLDRRWR